jgi:hypothetical protein
MYREEQKQLAAARMRCLSHTSQDGINKEMLTLGTNLIRTGYQMRPETTNKIGLSAYTEWKTRAYLN